MRQQVSRYTWAVINHSLWDIFLVFSLMYLRCRNEAY